MNLINLELIKTATWYQSTRMAVNMDKTKYIIFHPKIKSSPTMLTYILTRTNKMTTRIPPIFIPQTDHINY
jgi:hypothetical protein